MNIASGEGAIKSRGIMFVVMDETEGTWRCSIIHKICNKNWQILDEYGLSVIGTVNDTNEDGPANSWGEIYHHSYKADHRKVIADAQSSQPSAKENEVFQLPRRKKLHEDADLDQLKHGRKMRV